MANKFVEFIYTKQLELDQRVLTEKGITTPKLPERFLAFIVELGEMVNEWRRFKFWSATPFPKDRERLLDEYVDGLHFVFSIGIALGMDKDIVFSPADYGKEAKYEIILNQLLNLIYYVSEHAVLKDMPSMTWESIVSEYLHLGTMLGFSVRDIELGYFKKNNENHVRQNNGY